MQLTTKVEDSSKYYSLSCSQFLLFSNKTGKFFLFKLLILSKKNFKIK